MRALTLSRTLGSIKSARLHSLFVTADKPLAELARWGHQQDMLPWEFNHGGRGLERTDHKAPVAAQRRSTTPWPKSERSANYGPHVIRRQRNWMVGDCRRKALEGIDVGELNHAERCVKFTARMGCWESLQH